MKKIIIRERKSSTKTEILKLLSDKKIALSHKEFQEFFGNNIDRVTIYRALDRLVLEGKLHKIANFDGVILYALCSECENELHAHENNGAHKNNEAHKNHHHEHVHFNCVVCKETTCLENLIPRIDIPDEYEVKETQILVNGVCKKCKD